MGRLARRMVDFFEVFAAEIKHGKPFIWARLRRYDADLITGEVTKIHPEWGPEFVWYPDWAQFDEFNAWVKRYDTPPVLPDRLPEPQWQTDLRRYYAIMAEHERKLVQGRLDYPDLSPAELNERLWPAAESSIRLIMDDTR